MLFRSGLQDPVRTGEEVDFRTQREDRRGGGLQDPERTGEKVCVCVCVESVCVEDLTG